AVRAADGYEPIPEARLQDIRDGLVRKFDELCTCCGYCDKCPRGIPVPKVMDAYNHYVLGGMESMKERLDGHWSIDLESDVIAKCEECGICESACTQRLPICDRFRQMQSFLAAGGS
ncbi:aldo/keto reductase, partial [Verrucomicrobiota bacterium]